MKQYGHSSFSDIENGGVIQSKVCVDKKEFQQKDLMEYLYQSTWKEFAFAVMEGLDQVKQPVVVETDFFEYVDEYGMQVLHFKANFTPVKFSDVTLVRNTPLEVTFPDFFSQTLPSK